jgi:hypothetical protein
MRNKMSYEGRLELSSAACAFGLEKSTHALGLTTSGTFDPYPRVDIISNGSKMSSIAREMSVVDQREA